MFFDEILGQEYLKQMIQSSLSNNSFPQSKIIVDKDIENLVPFLDQNKFKK